MAKLKELAALVEGTVVGNADQEIQGIAPFDQAGKGDLTFIANPKYLSRLQNTEASAVIVTPGVEASGIPLLVCRNPYLAFARILAFLQVPPTPQGVMAGALVHPSAVLGNDVTVFPGCVVGENVSIGDRTILHPNVVL
jgi:UDP-3-O-[3-hydroxymyristoyl] glucosamine N-acyltransferase